MPVLPDGFMDLKSPTSSSMKNTFIFNRVTKVQADLAHKHGFTKKRGEGFTVYQSGSDSEENH